ncbi:MAG: response regulator [Pirellulales bacterium]
MNATMTRPSLRHIEILLVEDDAADAELTAEALKNGKILNTVRHVTDGVEALAYLRRQGRYSGAARPDVVLLDLNMPRKDGREVLAEMKADSDLKEIPVVILTTSDSDEDVTQSYALQANCFVTKPVGVAEFNKVVKSVGDFWFAVVKLPPPRSV